MNRYVLTLDFGAETDAAARAVCSHVMNFLTRQRGADFRAERVLCQCLDGAMYRNIVSIEAPK